MHPTTEMVREKLVDPKTGVTLRDEDGGKVASLRLVGLVKEETYDGIMSVVEKQTESLASSLPKMTVKAANGRSADIVGKGKLTPEAAAEVVKFHFGM